MKIAKEFNNQYNTINFMSLGDQKSYDALNNKFHPRRKRTEKYSEFYYINNDLKRDFYYLHYKDGSKQKMLLDKTRK